MNNTVNPSSNSTPFNESKLLIYTASISSTILIKQASIASINIVNPSSNSSYHPYQQASISTYECKKKKNLNRHNKGEEETQTRIGHGDVMAFVRIEPYFALSALHHWGSEPLLDLQRHHFCFFLPSLWRLVLVRRRAKNVEENVFIYDLL